MKKIEFIDQTIRDAQQSLWGNLMRTDHITPIAEVMDRVGYKAIATVGSQAFTVQVRTLQEDPWERIRLLSRLITKTPIRGSYVIFALSSFDLSTPRDIIALWIKRSVANGIKSFWVCDYQTDMEKFIYFARIAKEEGAEVVPSLMYTSSPVHTNELWASKTRMIASARDCVDRIMIEDASGVITPEATRELVATVLANCEGLPVEFHSHCNPGLAPLCYLEAIKAGITTLHTAVAPLANGTSLPAIETILHNAKKLGFTSDIDEDALAQVSAHFRKVAEEEGLPIGVPTEYDVFHYEHQVPGGMMTNLTRQLREVGMLNRLDEILDEVVLVRKDFGYPVMATPYSQIVGAQAVENVISGERYKQFTDEAIKYLLGYYGEPVGPVDQNVKDKVMSLSRTKEFINWQPENYLKSVDELRREIGPDLSDDDLLLKILIPGQPVKRVERKKSVKRSAGKPVSPSTIPAGFPSEFNVDVDGEVFNVKISPVWEGEVEEEPTIQAEKIPARAKKTVAEGAVLASMAGLVLSFEVKVGDMVKAGDLVAMIEAMKMRRHLNAPHGGVVKEILAHVGEIVEPNDILMVVA
ncbi:MAG TPA: pyruvate carboxylase subunit B [Syntrophorhabdus sp.]|jgi:pyruvate/oxaloacetate carboxyltransferase|nr:pyruvate carboxylase subunit B [Syntrophorhabdus sp.]HNQ46630.1 pyruvate carboxylase subunit B [Syntrophorhabdus sp.]HOD78549.1 pyruvate carboxylase subunit B [Syntrophorhabdus sp.]HQG24904.1 pyruvate carboxylase subunit B [Syntrophorhabdus sp.]HQH82538.1 pyruvate carboxylase subunit B [Syntrophorhabdus sp.]